MWTHEEYLPPKEKTTKITLENEHGTYSVEIRNTELTINALVRDVVKPVLLAAGYSESLVDEYLNCHD